MCRNLIILILLMFGPGMLSLEAQHGRTLRMAELNCENLFDTVHAEGFNDCEFLPSAERKWNSARYRTKLSKLAREIVSIAETEPLDLIALVEVENDTVLRDLTERTRLKSLNYKYIVTDSRDSRGLDVALLYLEGGFRPTSARSVCWRSYSGVDADTRDMLHVEGIVRNGDTLHVMVYHLPSRLGGRKSQKVREAIARGMRRYADSLMARPAGANIIIAGDFNDTPQSRSVRKCLNAKIIGGRRLESLRPFDNRSLYNISHGCRGRNGAHASYRYRGRWEMLDQFVVSGRMLASGAGLRVVDGSVRIVDHPFLLERDNTYGNMKPWRTYQGTLYRGGFSDHLPIVVELEIKPVVHK